MFVKNFTVVRSVSSRKSAKTCSLMICLFLKKTSVPEVLVVAGGPHVQRAEDFLGSEPIDVVVLDIGMPGMNGYEVARSLRREDWGRGLRLIAVTGWGQDEDKLRAAAAGFDTHLTKPFEPEHLEALVVDSATAG